MSEVFLQAYSTDGAHELDKTKGRALAIGNFDGVHLGHQDLVRAARECASKQHLRAAVLTFEPHPAHFFQPSKPLFRLASTEQKIADLIAMGAEEVILVTFNAELAGLGAAEFVDQILVKALSTRAIFVGSDFHFGANRQGDVTFLQQAGESAGFTCEPVPLQRDGDGIVISSSRVRTALAEGRTELAQALLGRPWSVQGEVVHGAKRGRKLGFPTANVLLDSGSRLRKGIYAVKVACEGKLYHGVANWGQRPHFDNGPLVLEAFLFDFEGDLYGKSIDISFHAFLRDEAKFASEDELVAQMQTDCLDARAFFAAEG